MTTIPAVVNITCQLYGQYVIYYNARKPDEEYPPGYSQYAYSELCEVEVYGCALGYYGSNCSLRCPMHCQNCDTETGACSWCDTGYRGENCDFPCLSGTFGANCTSQCGHCAGYCDSRYGNCSGGCTEGYNGILCNE
ncbi:multiple epidermal growth factor-like domains protein 11, partial [Saccostrea cucullata]|uniref:multiple epidermal growth factor-like domains protein 11 n=1 Tax=Saccostrea cuccullata TaxID=36930 RepID=UPI002ED5E78B